MLYFSESFGKPVYGTDGSKVGTFADFIFLPLASPVITKAVIRTPDKKYLSVPIRQFKKNEKGFTADMSSDTAPLVIEPNEASVRQHIQDKQIIDITGAKVIRANDVIVQDSPSYIISGIDIGLVGILRWLKPLRAVADYLRTYNIQFKSEFLAWKDIQPIEHSGGSLVLRDEKTKMTRLQPEDLADYLEKTSTINALKVLRHMDPEYAADVIADINTGFQVELFRHFTPKKAAEIIELIDSDEAVDILLTLSSARREKILPLLSEESRKQIDHLLKQATTPIGHLLTADYLSVSSDSSIKTIMSKVRSVADDIPEFFYVYVVNKNDQLTGVIGIPDLLRCPLYLPVYKVMEQNLIVIRLSTPREIALKKMLKYHIFSIPVVDEGRKLLGIVTLDSVLEEELKNVYGGVFG